MMNRTDKGKLSKSKKLVANITLIMLLLVLAIWPLITMPDAEFAGADGEAEEAITEIRGDYEPWFAPLIEPKSGEIESLLFALQAAAGSGVIFYILGFMVGRGRKEEVKL